MGNHESTAAFVRRAFLLLKKEAPVTYDGIVRELKELTTNFRVGDEKFFLTIADRDIKVISGRRSRQAKAEGEITLQGVFQLVDGTRSLTYLLDAQDLKIRAGSEALLNLSKIVKLFAEVATRSRALQDHFEEYRRWASNIELRKRL